MNAKLFFCMCVVLVSGTMVLADSTVTIESVTVTDQGGGLYQVKVVGKATLDKDHTFDGFQHYHEDPKQQQVTPYLFFFPPQPGNTTTWYSIHSVNVKGDWKTFAKMKYKLKDGETGLATESKEFEVPMP